MFWHMFMDLNHMSEHIKLESRWFRLNWGEAARRLTSAGRVREEHGSPLGHGGALLPHGTQRPVEDWVEREGGEGERGGMGSRGGREKKIHIIDLQMLQVFLLTEKVKLNVKPQHTG